MRSGREARCGSRGAKRLGFTRESSRTVIAAALVRQVLVSKRDAARH
jgi:hypothetical protein